MVSFNDSNKPEITEAEIQRTQHELRLIFPVDYRRFLLDFNGGKPVPNFLLIPDLNEKVIIDSFYGIGRPYSDLSKSTAELRYSLDMPEKFIPIAFDPGGNSLIMESGNVEGAEVYYWDSARHFALSTDEENAFLVAHSFADLLTKFEATM
jgi:hypothetical protein